MYAGVDLTSQRLVYQTCSTRLVDGQAANAATQHRRDAVASSSSCDQTCGGILDGLNLPQKAVWHAVQHGVAVVQTTADKAWTAVLAAVVVIDRTAGLTTNDSTMILNNCVSSSANVVFPCFKSYAGMPSGPGDLLFFCELIALITSWAVMSCILICLRKQCLIPVQN